MPAERRFGMDHPHYDWSPVAHRSVLRWPEDAPVSLCVIVNLEHMEWSPPADSYAVPLAGGWGPRPFGELAQPSHREYGHRVGIFRVLDVLQKHRITPTVAMDALTAEHYPYLVDHCLGRECEIIGHGISVSQIISSKMSEQHEREYIQKSLDVLSRATGSAPVGWLGPEYGESVRTPQLLAEAGIRYVCDWANDEQPYRIHTPKGELFALPVMLELDDINARWGRHVAIDRYGELLIESFDTLHRDGAQNGRLLVLNLHPWIIGQPFRIRHLDRALAHMTRRQGVWAATGSEIIDWYSRNSPTA